MAAARSGAGSYREEEPVADPLVVPFLVVVLDVLLDRFPDASLAEQDQFREAFFLYRPDPPLGEGVEIGALPPGRSIRGCRRKICERRWRGWKGALRKEDGESGGVRRAKQNASKFWKMSQPCVVGENGVASRNHRRGHVNRVGQLVSLFTA